jgi:hypothetical protein
MEEALKLKEEGKFKPDREKDELSFALGTPEHTGRVRGLGVIPWKHAFLEDQATYRSRSRSKAEQERHLHALEERIAALEERAGGQVTPAPSGLSGSAEPVLPGSASTVQGKAKDISWTD